MTDLPPLFFKECRFILARPLWHIFNSSLAMWTFPVVWKTTLVTPVFKAGDRSMLEIIDQYANYLSCLRSLRNY